MKFKDWCPTGVPVPLWFAFVIEADKVRKSGRTRYSARTIIEFLRHFTATRYQHPFKCDNNSQASLAKAYMEYRRCPGFFETRQRIDEAA